MSLLENKVYGCAVWHVTTMALARAAGSARLVSFKSDVIARMSTIQAAAARLLLNLLPVAFTLAAGTVVASPAMLTLKCYNSAGSVLTFKQVQALQKGPRSGAYVAETFIDPITLRLVTSTPMSDAGSLSFNLPAGKSVAFAINWPTTTQGYGLVIVDNGGKGFSTSTTVNFTYQAAKDIKRRLDAALVARSDYARSAGFNTAYNAAAKCLTTADGSTADSVKGAQGQLALEQLVVAYDLLLKEYGPVYARAHKATTAPWLGFTMEDISNYKADLDKLATMAGGFAWVRIVFQSGEKPSTYRAVVDYANAKGVKVLGLPVDSSSDTDYTRAQYLKRYQDFIAAFPTIDTWEVGNEVNGGWSSTDIAARVADVATYCKARGKKTYLTLFWQINTADPTFAVFNWINANLPAAVRANLDYLGLSQYQEQAPVGVAFDQIMHRMQAEFPNQKIGLAELGYWISGQRYWSAYNSDATAAKHAILEQYYKAALGYAGANGGCFWWNFASGGGDYDFDSTMVNTITGLKNFLSTAAPVKTTLSVKTASLTSSASSVALTIQSANGLIRVSWPSAAAGVLETAPLGNGPLVWSPVPAARLQAGDNEIFFAASPVSGGCLFRLRQ